MKKATTLIIMALLLCAGGMLILLPDPESEEEKAPTHHRSSHSKEESSSQSRQQKSSEANPPAANDDKVNEATTKGGSEQANQETLESDSNVHNILPEQMPLLDDSQSIWGSELQENIEDIPALDQVKQALEERAEEAGGTNNTEEEVADNRLRTAEVDEKANQSDAAPPQKDVAPPQSDAAPPQKDVAPPQSDAAPPQKDEAPPQQKGKAESNDKKADNTTESQPKKEKKPTPPPPPASTSVFGFVGSLFKGIWSVTYDYPTRLSYSLWSGFWEARSWDVGTYFSWGSSSESTQRRKMAKYAGHPFAYRVEEKEVKSSKYAVKQSKWSQKYGNNPFYSRSSSIFSRYRQILTITLLMGGFMDLLTGEWQNRIKAINSPGTFATFLLAYFTRGTLKTISYVIEKILYPLMQIFFGRLFDKISPDQKVLELPLEQLVAFSFCLLILIYIILSLLWGMVWQFYFPIRSFIYWLLVFRTLYVVLDIGSNNNKTNIIRNTTAGLAKAINCAGAGLLKNGLNIAKSGIATVGKQLSTHLWNNANSVAGGNGGGYNNVAPHDGNANPPQQPQATPVWKQGVTTLGGVLSQSKLISLAFKISWAQGKAFVQAGVNNRDPKTKLIFRCSLAFETVIFYIWLGQVRYLWTSHYIEKYDVLLAAPYHHKLVRV